MVLAKGIAPSLDSSKNCSPSLLDDANIKFLFEILVVDTGAAPVFIDWKSMVLADRRIDDNEIYAKNGETGKNRTSDLFCVKEILFRIELPSHKSHQRVYFI